MSGTEAEWNASEAGPAGARTPVASVSLRAASARVARDDDGEPVLIVSDGETAIELSCGLGGDPASAARGAHRLARALIEYASTIDHVSSGGG